MDIYYPVAHRSQEEIDSAKDRYKNFDTNFIPQLFKKALGVNALHWKKPSSWSTTHVIYFVTVEGHERPFVLRANCGPKKPEIYLKVEKLVTDQVQHLGVPVNKILYVDVSRKDFPFDFQIQETLDGVDIEDHFKRSREEYDELSFELGTYVAKLSMLTYEGFGRFDEKQALKNKLIGTKKSMYDYVCTRLDDDIQFLVAQEFITKKTATRIKKLFEQYKSIMQVKIGSLVQHDLADHNMFFMDNHITGIYDWEACLSGDPVLDLASCPTWRTHYPRETKLIEGFSSIKKLPEHFTEKMNIYRLRTMLWKSVFGIRAKIMNEERKKRFFSALEQFK